jgi:hypothetical protein
VWIFGPQNNKEKYAQQNIRGKAHDSELSQMIWECFVGNKLSPITPMNSSVNSLSDAIINVYRHKPVSLLNALKNDNIIDIIFQQDNAQTHTSKKKRWLFSTQQ